jgi:hypothetical protein
MLLLLLGAVASGTACVHFARDMPVPDGSSDER